MTHQRDDHSDPLRIPAHIEPGAPALSIQQAIKGLYKLERQQLLLDLDELLERNQRWLSEAIFFVPIERAKIRWAKREIHLNAGIEDDLVDDAIRAAIDEVIDLLVRHASEGTEGYIARLLINCAERHWTSDLVREACIVDYHVLGLPKDEAGTWLACHRCHRHARQLDHATIDAPTQSARQRL